MVKGKQQLPVPAGLLSVCLPLGSDLALDEWYERNVPRSLDRQRKGSLAPGAIAGLSSGLNARSLGDVPAHSCQVLVVYCLYAIHAESADPAASVESGPSPPPGASRSWPGTHVSLLLLSLASVSRTSGIRRLRGTPHQNGKSSGSNVDSDCPSEDDWPSPWRSRKSTVPAFISFTCRVCPSWPSHDRLRRRPST